MKFDIYFIFPLFITLSRLYDSKHKTNEGSNLIWGRIRDGPKVLGEKIAEDKGIKSREGHDRKEQYQMRMTQIQQKPQTIQINNSKYFRCRWLFID